MPTNVFFNHAVKTEQNLYEDLVVESLRMYGHEVYYLPRNVVEKDDILNEDVQSSFDDAYSVEMYLENTDGIAEQGDLMSKFGVYVEEEATFVISLRSWERFISTDSNLVTSLRPNEGDVIFFPLSGSMFEIRYVEDSNPFYQVGKLFVFKMRCTLFEYSNEDFETDTAADNIEADMSFANDFTMSVGDENYTAGENIQLDNEVVGEVIGWDGLSRVLSIRSLSKELRVGDALFGEESGVLRLVESVSDSLDFDDGNAQNDDFELNNGNFLDFSEINPLGEVN